MRDDECIKLDPLIAKLLSYFLERKAEVLSRAELIEQVFNDEPASEETVSRAVAVLRKALGGKSSTYIKSVPKVGYRFVLPSDVHFYQSDNPYNQTQKQEPVNRDTGPRQNRSWREGKLTRKSRDFDQPKKVEDKLPRKQALATRLAATEIDFVDEEYAPQKHHPLLSKLVFVLLASAIISIWVWLAQLNAHRHPTSEAEPKPMMVAKRPQLQTIAVLPFQYMSLANESAEFVDGLTERMTNSLTTVNGLLVSKSAMSFRYRDEYLDMFAVARSLMVNYVIKGSIRRNRDNRLQIIFQLYDANSRSFILTHDVELPLSEVVQLEQEMMQQVVAALNLSMPPREHRWRYSAELDKLDSITLERLFTARGKLLVNSKKSLVEGIEILSDLNQRFTDVPEIMGLLARGMSQYREHKGQEDIYPQALQLELAEKTLQIDRSNMDALLAAYRYYAQFADLYHKAEQIGDDVKSFYPGSRDGFELALSSLINRAANCKTLQSYVANLPQEMYLSMRLDAINTVVQSCNTKTSLNLDRDEQNMVSRVVAEFGLYDDGLFHAAILAYSANKSLSNQARLHHQLLILGLKERAQSVVADTDLTNKPWWQMKVAAVNYLHHSNLVGSQSSDYLPSDFIDFMHAQSRNSSDPHFVAALIQQAQNKQGNYIRQYLSKVPRFSVQMATREQVLGLMMLQHYAGLLSESAITAGTLLELLRRYKRQDPDAYRFWSLARLHFIAAIYTEKWQEAEQVLANGFDPQLDYWQLDIYFMRAVFAEHLDQPLVQELFKRIETDGMRARTMFN